MRDDTPIFGIRFGSSSTVQPTRDELERFLEQPKGTGQARQGQDLAAYSSMLEAIAAFERERPTAALPERIRDWMYYGVLGHSSFFHPSLRSALELYKYQLNAFQALDFRKPSAFIASAEAELARLNPKKKRDAAKVARLQDMVAERRTMLAALTRRRRELAAELIDLVRYVRDNLERISLRCETAIVLLVQLLVAGAEHGRMVDDIKERFKDNLRTALHQGAITRADLDAAKQDVELLSREMSVIVRDDIYAMTRLYEEVLDHARRAVSSLEEPLAQIASGGAMQPHEEERILSGIERALLSLVSDHGFSLQAAASYSKTGHTRLLIEKRAEMIEKIFTLVRQERRVSSDRRSGRDRRRSGNASYRGPERRSGKERRSRKSRRRPERPS